MFEQIHAHVQNCEACKLQARPTHQEQAHPIPVEGLFDRWEIDLVGPLSLTPRGNRYIAVAVEGLSHWPEAAPISQKTGAEVADFIYSHIYCRCNGITQLHSLLTDIIYILDVLGIETRTLGY